MIVLFSLLLVFTSHANEVEHTHAEIDQHIHGSHRECPVPKKSGDIVSCALEFHPSIQKGNLEVNSSKLLEGRASQPLNPVLSSRYVKGEGNGEDLSEMEVNLQFRLELGGKRDARVNHAKSILESSKLSVEQRKVEVKLKTVKALYRLNQALEEQRLVSESLSEYSKVIKKLKGISRLTSEQEASLTLFEIAYEDTKVESSEIYQEIKQLEHFFHIATGNSLGEIEGHLPDTPISWPVNDEQKHSFKSAHIKSLNAQSTVAENEIEIENSKAYPTLSIGPSVSFENGEDGSSEMLGVSFSLPLPLFQANGAGKAWARSKHQKLKKVVELTHAFESHERFEQLQIYSNTVQTLKRSLSISKLVKKHKRIEKLFSRGVVSNQVYLDSMKQKINYIKRRNQLTMTAISSLWNIYKFDGKALDKEIL